MVTNVVPYLANVFLHIYENEHLTKLIDQGDLETALLLSKTFRYQDDCIPLNNDDKFAKDFGNIFLPELALPEIYQNVLLPFWSFEFLSSNVNSDTIHMISISNRIRRR